MKIIIPVDEEKKEVCVSFGRTPYFMVYDTADDSSGYIENPAASAQGGAGLKAAQAVADSGAEALITFRCGENAAEVLQAADIKIYKASGPDISENISLCREKKLEVLDHFHAGFHGGR